MATSTTSNVDAARVLLDLFNAHDVKAMREGWTDDVSERFPDGTVSGQAALADYFTELFAALPDIHMNIQSITDDGDKVLVRWVMTGTHRGEFQGIKATDKAIEVDGFDEMTIRDGKLAHNFVVFDRQQFGQQLGLMPPDGSPAERGLKAVFNLGTTVKERLAKRR